MSPRTVRRPGRRAAGRRRSRVSTLAIGGAAVVVLLIASAIGYRAADTVPGREYYNLQAQFDEADNLSNHYEVRIGGLRAGQILKPRVQNGKALVDVRLDKKFAPLKSDSKLQVRLRSAVGVRYLEIVPGQKGTPLTEGDLLPTENQTDNVALDQTLGTLDPTTRAKAQTFLNELGTGTADNGADVNLALKKLTPFLRDTQTLAEPLNAQAGITSRFIRTTAAGVGAFEGVRDTLARAFVSIERGLKPFADDAPQIGNTLDEAAPTLNQLQRDLPNVDRLVAAVDGLAKDGRPALQQAPAALRETTRLAKGARPALRQAKTTLNLAKASVDPTIAVLETLQPQIARVDTALTSLMPTLRTVGPRACEIGNAFGTWSGYQNHSVQDRGNFIHFLVAQNPNDLLSGSNEGSPLNGLFDPGVRTAPYPEPCTMGGKEGEAGKIYPTAEEQEKDLTYSSTFPVVR